MTVPLKINNHSERAYELLLGQFKDKPIIAAVLQTWTDMYQEVENDLYSLMTETLFLNAKGDNLERYGQLLGIPFPDGMDASEFRELLTSEILKRSSDGTPDRIRQILEATTGIFGTKIFEHYNGKQSPWIMGCNVVYGYSAITNEFNVSIDTDEANYLAWASPVTTGSCVLGLHRYEPTSLFIPSEISTPLEKLGISSNKTTNPTFDADLTGWTYTSDKISWEETFADAEHPDGRLKIDVAGIVESPEFYQDVLGLDETNFYRLKTYQYNTQGYSSIISFTAHDKWVPLLDNSVNTDQAIQIPLIETVGPTEVSLNIVWNGGAGNSYIFDGLPSHEDSFNASISDGVLYIKQEKALSTVIMVNGEVVENGTYNLTPHTRILIQLFVSTGVAIDTLGNSNNLTGGFSGSITNFVVKNDLTKVEERRYPIIITSNTQPIDTVITETVSGEDGTLVNTTVWELITYSETLTGDDSSFIFIADVPSGQVKVISNIDDATDALFYFDQIEIYNEDTYSDQDELVNESDDWIAVSGDYNDVHVEGFENAILAEIGGTIDRFIVEKERDLEQFLVESGEADSAPTDTFKIEQVFEDRPANDHGVMLEISQTLLTETLQ